MIKRITLLHLLCPLISVAQVASDSKTALGEIRWVEELSWAQLKSKAKVENKYVFVDCYATWCKPCKMMDKEVYTNDTVSKYINEKFIAVKVQMDSSQKDEARIRNWYKDAHEIIRKYQVDAYPTFLFLSPEGKIVHKETGYKDVRTFLSIISDALNPQKQYFTLADNYMKGRKNYSLMYDLAITAYRLNDTTIANRVAKDYIYNYLLHLPKYKLYTQKNIQFISGFTKSSKDKGFSFLYKNADEINKLMNNSDYVQSWVHYIIKKEKIDPVILRQQKFTSNQPDWEGLTANITKEFNNYYAYRIIIAAKLEWFSNNKDWPQFTKYLVEFVEKYGSNMNDYSLAQNSWAIFMHSIVKTELNAALKWATKVITRNTDSLNILPNIMDTYANLLHKIGYLFDDKKSTQEAINMEKRAFALMNLTKNEQKINIFRATINKMQRGEPTWQ